MTATDNLLTVEDCLRAVRELRAELAEVRQQLATEVRTRRLVVVDDAGAERIVGEVGATSAEWKHPGVATLQVSYQHAGPGTDAVVGLSAGAAGSESKLGREISMAAFEVMCGGELVSTLYGSLTEDWHKPGVMHTDAELDLTRSTFKAEDCTSQHHLRIEVDRIGTGRDGATPDARAVFNYLPT